jgi:hypothetical protein
MSSFPDLGNVVMYFLVLIGRLIGILIQFLEYKFNSCVIFLSGWSVRSIFVKDPVYDNIKDRNENKMGENTTPSKQYVVNIVIHQKTGECFGPIKIV